MKAKILLGMLTIDVNYNKDMSVHGKRKIS